MLDLCRVQVHDKNIKDTAVMDESADEDMRATKRTATIGSSGDVEGSILQTVAPRKLTDGECCTAELKSLKKVETNAGTITKIIIFEYSKQHGSCSARWFCFSCYLRIIIWFLICI